MKAVATERGQHPVRTGCDLSAEQDLLAKRLAKIAQPGSDVGCRADNGKIQPVTRSDISVGDLPDIQPHAKLNLRLAVAATAGTGW